MLKRIVATALAVAFALTLATGTAVAATKPAPAKRRCSPIQHILNHLGLSPPGQQQPAPAPEVVRVPVDEEGREILAG